MLLKIVRLLSVKETNFLRLLGGLKMPDLKVIARISQREAAEVYSILCNFNYYSENSQAVRSVNVQELPDGRTISAWEVEFRGGILKWSEEDYFDVENFVISFDQTEGDVECFSGEWKVEEREESCIIVFSASFDMGIPSLSHILDPIATQTLQENIVSIITGLFGSEVEIILPTFISQQCQEDPELSLETVVHFEG